MEQVEKNKPNLIKFGIGEYAYRIFVGKPEGRRPLGRP
jgi:hypothetical protein